MSEDRSTSVPPPPAEAAGHDEAPVTPRYEAHLIVFTLWLLVFSSASQTMILSPILPTIGDELGISDSLLGTLVSAYSIMVGVFAILAGPVSDTFGRRRILLLGCGTMTVALVLHGFVADYTSFIAVRVFAGAAGGMLSGAAVSYIGDYFPYQRRGWATGWVMSGSAFGQIFGIPLGIFMAQRWGFRSPFYLFAVTMALTVILIFLRVPQPDVVRNRERLSGGRAARDYMVMLRRPEVAWAAASFFMMFLGVSMYVIYLPTWLERQGGVTGDQITAYVFFFASMVLVAMRISPFSALLTALVSDERRGSLMSLTVALGQLGFALGGAIAGPLYAGIGYQSNTYFAAASVLIMGLIVWFFIPEPELEAV